ncbi:hypothetical protein NDU88_004139 [Pleurodeles waltl]|uniref:Uncharacterized protein n=1 Tax=Pleurodeles waltl TaxID=8319 RepID=A0AAV7QB15_PLEWA|nr:hypothetical protein NDU88_004139 [Pleurodeles waltl]
MDRMHDRPSLSHHPLYPPPVALGGTTSTLTGLRGLGPTLPAQGCVKSTRLHWDRGECGRRPRAKMAAPWARSGGPGGL